MIYTGAGDLLSSGLDAIVNPVNCDGVMGKGLALQFKQRWPAMFVSYQKACWEHHVQPGRVHVWPTGAALGSGTRFVINFPTKRSWRDSSRIEDIALGLVDLADTARRLDIRSLGVPALGAGLGGLDWAVVRPCLVEGLRALTQTEPRQPGVRIALWPPR